MAAAVGRNKIGGILDAVKLVDSGVREIVVFVERVELRDAPALLQVINTAANRKTLSWSFPRDAKLKHLARISNEIDVLLRVVTPMLKATPTSDIGGRLLERYAWSLGHIGFKVDGPCSKVNRPAGPFSLVAAREANLLRRHARHIHSHHRGGKPTRGLQFLRDHVDVLEEKLWDLKRLVVLIPDVDEVVPGGDGEYEENHQDGDGHQDNDDEEDNYEEEMDAAATT